MILAGSRSASGVWPAAGLFYVAEIVEEYTVTAKRVLRIMILVRALPLLRCRTGAGSRSWLTRRGVQTVLGITFLLGVAGEVALSVTFVGLVANTAYYTLLESFPSFHATSLSFLASGGTAGVSAWV